MIAPHDLATTIIVAVFASTGFWAFLTHLLNAKSGQRKMLRGLGHDRILWLGMAYIKRGYITRYEYENLVDYLYKPYKELGGNGTAERVIEEIKRLPIREKTEPQKGEKNNK